MPRGGDDRGATLIEVLIAIMVLAIVFVGALTSLSTSTLASDRHRQIADAHAILLSAAELVKSPNEVPYISDCSGNFGPYLSQARKATLPAQPTGYWTSSAITISSVLYWTGSTFGATCYDATQDATGDYILRLQQITITVTSPDGKVAESLDVVKVGTTQ